MYGGKIPNYKNLLDIDIINQDRTIKQHEETIKETIKEYEETIKKHKDTLVNLYKNRYLPLQQNIVSIDDIHGNAITQTGTRKYQINYNLELESLDNDEKKDDIPVLINNRNIQINDNMYPFYYVLIDNKFKIVEKLYNMAIADKQKKIKEFIELIFIFEKGTDDVYSKIFNIFSKNNLLHKYLFINKFKFLLELLFNKELNVVNTTQILSDKLIQKLPPNKINIAKNIQEKLLTIFYTTDHAQLPNKFSLENLCDLSIFQNYLFQSPDQIINKLKIGSQKNLLDNQLDNYLDLEILEIIKYIDYLEEIKDYYLSKYPGLDVNRQDDLGMIILLSYFYKRVYIKNVLYPSSFPFNINSAISDLITNSTPIDEPILNNFFYSNNLPAYPSEILININDFVFTNCVETAILHFIRTIFWDYENNTYNTSIIKNAKLQTFFIDILKNQNQIIDQNTHQKFAEILYSIDNIIFVNKDKKCELEALMENIIICLDALLNVKPTSDIINIFKEQQQINEWIEKIRLMYQNIIKIEFNNSDIKLQTNAGDINLNVRQDAHAEIEPLNLSEELKDDEYLYVLNKFQNLILFIDSYMLLNILKYLDKHKIIDSNPALLQNIKNNFSEVFNLKKNYHEMFLMKLQENIEQEFFLLQYIPETLHNYIEIVKLAVIQNGMALDFASKDMQNNAEIVKLAVIQNGMALNFASKDMQNNAEIVKLAVIQNGMALDFASKDMQNNAEIVKLAVIQNGMALYIASKDMQNNTEIVKLAVRQNGMALNYASYDLQKNEETIKIAIESHPMILLTLLDRFNLDLEMIKRLLPIAIEKDVNILIYLKDYPDLQKDRDIKSLLETANKSKNKYLKYKYKYIKLKKYFLQMK